MKKCLKSEFRKDVVSGDWILIATERSNRPHLTNKEKESEISFKDCPFEDPQKDGSPDPILWFPFPENGELLDGIEGKITKDWFLQIIPNKYPALIPHKICPNKKSYGPYKSIDGRGFHEVIITKNHNRFLAKMSHGELITVLKAFKDRYLMLKKEPCLKYILIFNNHGKSAGASIQHPHSQLVAFPIIPPDVMSSLKGSKKFFKKNNKCVHCVSIDWEIEKKERVIEENEDFIAFCPFVSHASYEVRIFPKKHSPYFEKISDKENISLADIAGKVLSKIHKNLKNPDHNLFIHTAPLGLNDPYHYHWHLEILPRTNTWAGLELATGIEVITVSPENAAEELRN